MLSTARASCETARVIGLPAIFERQGSCDGLAAATDMILSRHA